MSLRLTKPVGYSFASNYIKGKIARDDAAKAGTSQGPSQDKVRATPFQAKAKVVCATPNPSTLVSPLKLVLTLPSITDCLLLSNKIFSLPRF